MSGSSKLMFSVSVMESTTESVVNNFCNCCRNERKFVFNISKKQRKLLNRCAKNCEVSNSQIQVLLRIGRKCEKGTYWDKVPYGFQLNLNSTYIPYSKNPINLTPYVSKLPSRRLTALATWDRSDKFTYIFNAIVLRMNNCHTFVPYVTSRTRSQQSFLLKNNMDTEDLEITSQNVSLLCPLTMRRMEVPVQGRCCNHMQCFDAVSFFSLNLLNPKWVCPVCLRPTYPQDLVTDRLWNNMLEEASTDVVSVRADGSWTPVNTFVQPSGIEQYCV